MLKNFSFKSAAVFFLATAIMAQGAPHKLKVSDRALADALISQGGKLVADYGGFQLLEISELPAAKAASFSRGFENVDRFYLIELNAATIDTRTTETSALRGPVAAFSGKHLHMVQFVGPVKPEWRAALEKTGASIVHYLPQNAYLVYADATALAQLQSWAAAEPAVQWEGEYTAAYKIHPRARAADAKGNPRKIGTDIFAIQLVADEAANAATLQLIEQLKLAPIRKQSALLGYRNIIVPLPADQLDTLAAQPDVVSIHPYFIPHKLDERQDQIIAGNLSGSSPSGPGYLEWLASKGFTQAQFDASGFVVDLSDSGIDNGTTHPGHFALYPQADISTNSRVVYNRLEGTPNPGSTLAGCDGHGTLNAHIVCGYVDITNGFPHIDNNGYEYDLGVCPFVKVGSSVVFDPTNDTSPDYVTLQTQAYNDGARISNNSWGDNFNDGSYDTDSQQFDALVRDVGGSSNERQMVIVFAAGNSGPTSTTVDAPGTAKNVITVGASENVRSMSVANGGNQADGDDGCGGDQDSLANNANDMTSFSSRGPCADGRVKPDLVAPGIHITGGVPQSSLTTNGTGSAISCYNAEGVCGLYGSGTTSDPDNFFPLNQEFYTESTGTSHATPAVCGAAALLRQYFINNSGTPPSPAMTKAYLMNSARYLTGTYVDDTLPSTVQGMGEVNLATEFDGVARVLRDQLPADVFTGSGQSRSFSGYISDTTKPFRVTLAWTDAAGSTAASQALMNDLDLTVTVGGKTYLGNVFSGATSTTGGTADSLNNVESVFLPAGVSGPYTVTVNAANIAADGISNGNSANQQDFALVIYNATLTTSPSISVSGFSVVGESCSPTNGAVDPGETVTVNFTLQNLGTANTSNLTVTLLDENGVSNASGTQAAGALITNGAPATVQFTFTASGTCGGAITPTFALADGSLDLGQISGNITLGALAPIYLQYFDTVTPPALPVGWSATKSNGAAAWVTTKVSAGSKPNSAFCADSSSIGINALTSPVIQMPTGSSQLQFQNSYNLENGFDGGVLEIQIGGGAFEDITEAGATFVSGGYNSSISTQYGNPIGGRSAWSGNSGGFVTTLVDLPSSVSGQQIQLRWRCGTDQGNQGITGTPGWYVDSIQISSRWCCPGQEPPAPFVPAPANYSGLFFQTNAVQVASSGAVTATTDGRGTYTGTLQTGGGNYQFKGIFDPFGAASNTVTRGKSPPLQLLMQMDTSDNSRLTGTVSSSNWVAVLDLERSRFDAKTNPAPWAGKYTLIFPGAGNASASAQPQGDGFATLSVDGNGILTVNGNVTMADSKATAAVPKVKISDAGLWPLYAPLYSGQGLLIGWLAFSNAAPNISGAFNWQKNAGASAVFYPAGFNITSNAAGSLFQAPAKGAALLNSASAQALFVGGNYFGTFTNIGTNSAANQLVYKGTNGLTLTFNAASGTFSGSIRNPANSKTTIPFNGVILQAQQVASGFLLGTNQAGKTIISP